MTRRSFFTHAVLAIAAVVAPGRAVAALASPPAAPAASSSGPRVWRGKLIVVFELEQSAVSKYGPASIQAKHAQLRTRRFYLNGIRGSS